MLYVNSCCCTCLSTENLHNIHTNDAENVKWLDKLLFCLTEKDSIFECAPLLMCEKCCKLLQEFYNFKKISLKNMELFRNCLKQLIKNPFACLSIQPNKQNTVGQSTDNTRQSFNSDIQIQNNQTIQNENNANVVANVQIGAIVKLEEIDGFINNNENNAVESQEMNRNEGETSRATSDSFSLKIHNVESLNSSYKKRLAKTKLNEDLKSDSESSSSCEISDDESSNLNDENFKPKRKFPKKTICHPCGKKFIRDDFYINHILSCTKTDIKTKNSVLNCVSKKTRKLIVTGQMKLNPSRINLINSCSNKKSNPNNKSEPENSIEAIKTVKEETAVKNAFKIKQKFKKRKLDRFERVVCNLCKRNITKRFFRKHFKYCSRTQKEKKGEMFTIMPKNNDSDNK